MTGKRASMIALLAVLCTTVALAPALGAPVPATHAQRWTSGAPPVIQSSGDETNPVLLASTGSEPLLNVSHLRTGPVVLLGSGVVNALAAVGDGRLAVGTESGELLIVNETLNVTARHSIGSSVNALAFLQGGALAAGLDSGDVRLFDPGNLSSNISLKHGTGVVWSLVPLGTPGSFASGGGDRKVSFWTNRTGPANATFTFNSSVRILEYLAPTDELAVGLYNGEILRVDRADGRFSTIGVVAGNPRSAAVTTDGRTLAVGTSKGELHAWSNGSRWTKNLSASGLYVSEWDPRWSVFLAAGTDGVVRFISPEGEFLGSQQAKDGVRSAASTRNGFVIGDSKGGIRLIEDRQPPKLILQHPGPGNGVVRTSGPRLNATLGFDEGIALAGSVWARQDAQSRSLAADLQVFGRTLFLDIDVKELEEGRWELGVDGVEDLAGNIASSSIGRIIVDRSPPVAVAFAPAPGSQMGPGSQAIRVTFDEPLTLDAGFSCRLTMSDGSLVLPVASKLISPRLLEISVMLDLRSAEGPFTVNLSGFRDVAGNIAPFVLVDYKFDPSPPLAEAGEDIDVRDGAVIVLDGSRSREFTTARWEVDGHVYRVLVARHQFPTQGDFVAMLTVWDDAGNSASDGMLVSVRDMSAPSSKATPAQNPTNRSQIEISVDASDAGGAGLRLIEVIATGPSGWSARGSSNAKGAHASELFTFTPGVDGTYKFTSIAFDANGNRESPGHTTYVFVDRRPPVPKQIDPMSASGVDRMNVSVEFDEPVLVSAETKVLGLAPGMQMVELRTENSTLQFSIVGGGASPFSVTIEGVHDAAGNEALPLNVDYAGGSSMDLDTLDFVMGVITASSCISLSWAWTLRPAGRFARRRASSSLQVDNPGILRGNSVPSGNDHISVERSPGRAERLDVVARGDSLDLPQAPSLDDPSEFDEAVKRLLAPPDTY